MQYLIGSRGRTRQGLDRLEHRRQARQGRPRPGRALGADLRDRRRRQGHDALPGELRPLPDRPRRSPAGAVVAAVRRFVVPALAVALVAGLIAFEALSAGSERSGRAGAAAAVARSCRRRRRSLASLRGEPALINFWASWCEPCRQEAPELERLRPLAARRAAWSASTTPTARAPGREFIARIRLDLPDPRRPRRDLRRPLPLQRPPHHRRPRLPGAGSSRPCAGRRPRPTCARRCAQLDVL